MKKVTRIDIYALNFLLLIIYFAVFFNLEIPVNDEVMFIASDAQEYIEESSKFYQVSETETSIKRPFFYPLFLLLTHSTFGATGTWMAQLLLWMISINLLYLSIKKITGNTMLAFAGSIFMALNLSLIALTLHGLTEVISTFFLSLLLYIISVNISSLRSLKFIHAALFTLSLLTVTKPLFYLPLLFTLLVPLPIFYLQQYRQHPKKLLVLILVLSPLLFQLTMMKIKYDTFTVSNVSSLALRNYLVTQVIQEKDSLSWEQAQAKAQELSTTEALTSWVWENKKEHANFYLDNLKVNVKSKPTFLRWPKDHPALVKFMVNMNAVYYYLHIIFFLPVLIAIYIAFRKKHSYLIPMLISFLLAAYIIFTSGISLMQGDRLVIIGLPLWIFLYILLISMIKRKIFPDSSYS